MQKSISPLKWCFIFLTSAVLGVIIFYLSVYFIFKPDFLNTPKVAHNILNNLGNAHLKIKAYYPIFYGLLPMAITIIWFFMPRTQPNENYGNARFATKKDFKELGISNDNGLILGTFINKNRKNEVIGFDFIRANKPLATLVVAPPGRGKTAGIIIPNLFTIKNSCVVFDIKGELLQKTAGYRQEILENEVQVFSPFSWDNTLFFNPFDNSIVKDMQYIHIKKLAEQIASTIFVGEKGKENDHWVVSAKTMFVFFAEYFLQKNKHTTLGELAQAPKADYYDLLDPEKEFFREVNKYDEHENDKWLGRDYSKDTFKTWLKEVSADESLDDNTRNQARAYSTAAEQEFASIKSTYDSFMKVFTNPQVANATSKMSFAFKDLREKKLSLYIVIQTEDMEVLAPLVRIFTETLFKTLMSGEECSDPNKFIYCFLDEFVRFGKMPFLLEAPALCRSYGLIPVFVTQSYEQIKKYYGEDDLAIITANAGYQTIFAMNTTADAKKISELIGDFTRTKSSVSQGNLDLFKNNQSISKEGYKLVTEQDIKNQKSEDLLILVGGFLNRPIKCKVPYWFKNPDWIDADKKELKQVNNKEEDNATNNKDNNTNNNANDNANNSTKDNANDNAENEKQNKIKLEDLGIKTA